MCPMMTSMTSLPTGIQHELTLGRQRAVVTELGAALRSYEADGRAVVDGFAPDRRPDGGRGQVLAPWPNRIQDGKYSFAGEQHQLPLTEVAARNAIHGLVRWATWALVDRTDSSVSLTTTVWPQPGYPFLLRLRATYALDDTGLRVEIAATNDGAAAAPYGVGHHPYVTLGGPVDEATLTVPARRRLETDDRGNPVRSVEVAGTAFDFRSPRRIGDLRLDTAYSELTPDADGRACVRLEHGERGVEVWLGDGASQVQVYTGDNLPEPARRRQGLAVEPTSCPPGAFVSGTDLIVLEPGGGHILGWGIRSW